MGSVMRSFRWSEELNARVNAAAGENFSAWMREAAEVKLGLSGPVQQASDSGPPEVARALVDRRTELLRRARK
jgi:hypothetical protein